MVEHKSYSNDDELQAYILKALQSSDHLDSDTLITELMGAQLVDAALKSLLVDNYVVLEVISKQKIELSEEGAEYATKGTPEYQYTNALVLDQMTPKDAIEAQVGAQIAKIGFAKAMGRKWVKLSDDKTSVMRIAAELIDEDMISLSEYRSKPDIEHHPDKKKLEMLKKRKLVSVATKKSYKVTKGTEYAPERAKLETQLTAEMLRTGAWKDAKFKKQNLDAAGQVTNGGHLHPLLKVRSQFRESLLEMGFNEMPTDRFVESSFWNFDSLFQP